MPSNRQQVMMIIVVLVAGVILLAGFYFMLNPRVYRQMAVTEPIGFRLVAKRTAFVDRGHLVTAAIWSNRDADIVRGEVRYRRKGQAEFQGVPMVQVGRGDFWAAELPALPMGESYYYYVTATDDVGMSVSIPSSAPQPPLMQTRWETPVNRWEQVLYLALLVGAAIFMVHALYFALLILFGRVGDLAQKATASRAHQSMRWGWLAFFVTAVPLSIHLHWTALGVDRAWLGWPMGRGFGDTRAELVLLFFGVLLLLRWDLFRFSPTRPRKPRFSNTVFGWLILVGAILTLILYIFPPGPFLQLGV